MIKMSAICEEETNTISFLRIMATLGVLLVHVNGKIPLPGIIGSIAGYGADWSKMLLLFDRLPSDDFMAKKEVCKRLLEKEIS